MTSSNFKAVYAQFHQLATYQIFIQAATPMYLSNIVCSISAMIYEKYMQIFRYYKKIQHQNYTYADIFTYIEISPVITWHWLNLQSSMHSEFCLPVGFRRVLMYAL